MTWKIVDRRNPLAVFARGFFAQERAEAWVTAQRADMDAGRHIWVDKTLTADDFLIVEDAR